MFDSTTQAQDVAAAFQGEISGKTFVITGVGFGGLGAAVCEALAPYSPGLLIITGRDIQRPQAFVKALITQYADLKISVIQMDLASTKSVENAVQEIEKIASRIHVLVNNAGVMCIPDRTLTETGIQAHLAINYLGHFLLAKLLAEHLSSPEASGRVINVSSSAHAVSPFRFGDPHFFGSSDLPPDEEPSRDACLAFGIPWESGYSPLVAYAQSKTAVILHARAISCGVLKDGITAFSVNPGVPVKGPPRYYLQHYTHWLKTMLEATWKIATTPDQCDM
ncbi:retinol dehydrogenase 13 [Fusarium denticulatum]|uniref:Retinol dehydrogenase 13 n=1 Tax=Fusarium denticulatum TaxID=48507 RepID=A0A8H5SY69_9HYPO|nr:retinol dehydrogenase 13 [Fusarium denticulatum]